MKKYKIEYWVNMNEYICSIYVECFIIKPLDKFRVEVDGSIIEFPEYEGGIFNITEGRLRK